MKYLLTYKGFCKFIKEWEVLTDPHDLNNTVIQLQKGPGLIGSDTIHVDKNGGYTGTVHRIGISCFVSKIVENPIKITLAGTAGDSFTFSLPQKFHSIPQYHIHYENTIQQCILVNDIIYEELKHIGITS